MYVCMYICMYTCILYIYTVTPLRHAHPLKTLSIPIQTPFVPNQILELFLQIENTSVKHKKNKKIQKSKNPKTQKPKNPQIPNSKIQKSKNPQSKSPKTKMQDSVDVNSFGFLEFWFFRLLDFWIFGCLDFWNVGFLDACGYLHTRNCISVYRRCQG